MKDIGEGTIRRIDWTELTPVVLLLRIFNIALGLRVLALALLGLWLTLLLSFALNLPLQDHPRNIEIDLSMPIGVWDSFVSVAEPCFSAWERPEWLLWLPGFVLIWTLCGGMICRIVAVRLTVDESEPTGSLLLFFRKRGISFISSLLILSLGILCCFLPVKIAYWLAAVPSLDYVVAILLPIPMLFAFFTVILTFGLAVGWMLLFAAVSVDGSDGFDAISRMFSYIFQRPLHYLFYWCCSGILGWLGLLLVAFISFCVVDLCQNIRDGGIADFWIGLVELLPSAYAFAWFWTSSVAIYLLLRRSVDATPFSEVYRVSPPKVRTLPVIKSDERGAPSVVADKPLDEQAIAVKKSEPQP